MESFSEKNCLFCVAHNVDCHAQSVTRRGMRAVEKHVLADVDLYYCAMIGNRTFVIICIIALVVVCGNTALAACFNTGMRALVLVELTATEHSVAVQLVRGIRIRRHRGVFFLICLFGLSTVVLRVF